MKFAFVLIGSLMAVGLAPGQEDQELKAARLPVEKYLEGHATGRQEPMLEAFHAGARIQGSTLTGEFRDWSFADYVKGFTGKPAPGAESRKRTLDFVQIEGSAGMARATLDMGQVIATDFFVLVKRDGVWGIANKVFSVRKK